MIVGLTLGLLVAAAPLSNRWLVIDETKTVQAPGLVDTTPLSGLRPNLFIHVAGSFENEAKANAHCADLKKKGGTCYVKFAGQRAAEPAEVDAAIAKTKTDDIVYRLDVKLRGRRVPLVVRGKGARTTKALDKWCEEGWRAFGTPSLYWAATPHTLPKMIARKRTCCSPLREVPAPKGVTVLTQRCTSPSCGGMCLEDTFAIVIPHGNIADARAEYIACTKDFTTPPDPASHCDTLKSNANHLSFTQTRNVSVTDCEDAEDAWEKIIADVETTTFEKGRLRSRRNNVPIHQALWGCGD